MDLDPVLLARAQFGFTIAFHIIFPSFTIGLSAYIATLEILWGATGADRFKRRLAGATLRFRPAGRAQLRGRTEAVQTHVPER